VPIDLDQCRLWNRIRSEAQCVRYLGEDHAMSRCCTVTVTDDVEKFRSALRPGDSEVTITESGHFAIAHTRVDLHRMWMQGANESLPRIWEGSLTGWRHSFSLLTASGRTMFMNGTEVGSADLAVHKASETTVCHRLSGPTGWGTMSLPAEEWSNTVVVTVGHDPIFWRIVQPEAHSAEASTRQGKAPACFCVAPG
jgi:hypothetical protein